MLSQGNPFNSEYATPQGKRNYKTDIFHLSPQDPSPRKVLDRNRSSVFDMDPVESKPMLRQDRMASDLFFQKKFGSYEPSVGQSRRATPREQVVETPMEAPIRDYECQEQTNDIYEQAAQHEAQYKEYSNHQDQSQYQKETRTEENGKMQHQISSIFDADKPMPVRGSRRHFSQQQSSTGIFETEVEPAPKMERFVNHMPEKREVEWVPSVKQSSKPTSFSNLFGDWAEIDRSNRMSEPRRTSKPVLSPMDKLSRVGGLSSTDLNRTVRGKARRNHGNESQIWF